MDTEKGILYLCPTPIGNLSDISERIIETIKSVDLIAAEDTRNTLKLLNYFDICVPLTSYYEHNKVQKGNILIKKLLEGKNIALVSDAGMPAISDPGEDLVKLCVENDINIVALPGPCAFATALIASGLPTGRFAFEGFLTTNKKNRFEHLEEIKNDTHTLIFYEAPHKLLTTLRDIHSVLGNRRITIARELTKKFEEYLRFTIQEAIVFYETNPPKGEFVLIIEGANKEEIRIKEAEAKPSIQELLTIYISQGESGKPLVKKVADELSLPKRQVYDEYLKIKNER